MIRARKPLQKKPKFLSFIGVQFVIQKIKITLVVTQSKSNKSKMMVKVVDKELMKILIQTPSQVKLQLSLQKAS